MMSAEEFESWIAYDRISPIGPMRGDLRAAIVAQVMANCHLGRNQRPFNRTDFMPFYQEPKRTDDQIGDIFMQWGQRIAAALEAKKQKQQRKAERDGRKG